MTAIPKSKLPALFVAFNEISLCLGGGEGAFPDDRCDEHTRRLSGERKASRPSAKGGS